MARLWGAVSAAHRKLARRHAYYLASAVEDRLSEQLSFLATLQDWLPATSYEADELRALVLRYVQAPTEVAIVRAAEHLVEAVRTMARTRGRLMADQGQGATGLG